MKISSPPQRLKPLIASLASILILLPILISMMPSVRAQPASRGLGVSPPDQVRQWPGSAKRWALIIGVDKYKDGQISALKGAANDANALAEALVRYAGFPSDQVILMTTSQPEERQPTRVNILRRLSNLASFVPKDGLLLVAFAGHGMERASQAFLLPSDAQISDDVTFLEETAVSVARMKDRIRASGVGQVVLMLDACRNDPGGRANAPNPLTTAYTRAFNFDVRNREVTAFATLYATAIGQRAYEYTEKRQGYFTWAIVEGLKGGAANDHGEVTLASLLKFVQETVPKRIGIDLGAGKQQRPFAVVEGYRADELVIAVGGKGAPASAEEARTETAPSFDPAAMEMSFWESIKNSTDPEDYQAYLEKYPNGTYAALARRRAGAAASTTGNAAAMPTVNQIIENNIRAAGGKEAMEQFTTIVQKGLIELSAGGKTFQGTTEFYRKRPDKTLSITKVAKLFNSLDGYDGTIGWIKDDRGVHLKNDWQLAFAKRNAVLSWMTDVNQFFEIYPKSRLKGREKFDNREVFVVEVEAVGSKPETLYFDTQTGLLVRWDILYQSSDAQKGVGVPMQLYVDEYADINGLMVAVSMRQVSSGLTITTRFFDTKYNVPIDDAKFIKPNK
jgi:hypothetical protein